MEAKEGGEQFYVELLTRVVNLQISLKEAGEHAIDFKRLATAQADMVALLHDPAVTNWAEAEAVYPKHCSRERLDPILRSYLDHKPQKGDPDSKYPKQLKSLVDEARKCKAGSSRVQTEEDKVWAKSSNTGEYTYLLADKEDRTAHFKVVTEDMEKIAISTEVPKIPYRFVMLDVWYDLPDAWGVSNPDGMTAEAFGRVLDGMMSINTSRLITIVVFLSHSQKVPFFEQLKQFS